MDINKKNKSIDIIIKRAKKIGLPIILATTKNKNDNKLVNYVKKNYNIIIFRGSENNKLQRWYDCFCEYNIDNACMIDGDDLCFDYSLYKEAIKKIKLDKIDLIKNNKSLITGLFTYVLNITSLNKSINQFKFSKDTEMAFIYFKKSKLKEHLLKTKSSYNNKKIRLTLDYLDDFYLFKLIYSIYPITIDSSKIVKFLDKNSFINNLNYDREISWSSNINTKIK